MYGEPSHQASEGQGQAWVNRLCVCCSSQRLHALQMELAAVQLLRQQLQEGVRNNEDLRQDLEREVQHAKQRQGAVHRVPAGLHTWTHIANQHLLFTTHKL